MRTLALLAGLLLTSLAVAPLALAGNNTYNVPPTVDVNVNNGGGGSNESTGFFGLNTTVVIVLIVLAVVVIALVVALASRPGYP